MLLIWLKIKTNNQVHTFANQQLAFRFISFTFTYLYQILMVIEKNVQWNSYWKQITFSTRFERKNYIIEMLNIWWRDEIDEFCNV